ncbi:hypothetical protein CR513_21367, partial [Mucuna pruriens]
MENDLGTSLRSDNGKDFGIGLNIGIEIDLTVGIGFGVGLIIGIGKDFWIGSITGIDRDFFIVENCFGASRYGFGFSTIGDGFGIGLAIEIGFLNVGTGTGLNIGIGFDFTIGIDFGKDIGIGSENQLVKASLAGTEAELTKQKHRRSSRGLTCQCTLGTNKDEENKEDGEFGSDEEETKKEEQENKGIEVFERKLGKYECPTTILSKEEELRIKRPWWNGIIIEYKVLETGLKQMRARNDVIHFNDIGNDFFLVIFSNKEDKEKASTEEPHLKTTSRYAPKLAKTSHFYLQEIGI